MAAQPGTAARRAPRGSPASLRVEVDGVVQGVGFRPFVWRLATGLGLAGQVRNVAGRVEIDAYGDHRALEDFVRRLSTDAPPQARVDAVRVGPRSGARSASADVQDGFSIVESATRSGTGHRDFPPDLATCEACLAELHDPTDRRYRYPFLSCTACGPRATIIDDLPYDRGSTTMRVFPLCPSCAAEYTDPADRRFHAEPVACPACGPRLAYRPSTASRSQAADRPDDARRAASDDDATAWGDAALDAAVADLRAGRTVAVKGLGGYHLACDATDEDAVRRLRVRKRRWAKPFAVMVADVAAAGRLAVLDDVERRVLTGPARPVLLAAARPDADPVLAPSVAAGAPEVGLLLPYTALHHLLLEGVGRPLVMTSGNLSDEPLATQDDDAARRLAPLADAFLSHDRTIRARYDDSVVRVVAGRGQVLRRGRGLAPSALPLPVPAARPLLGVGAELKHTVTLAHGGYAHVAPHNGDLEDLLTHTAFTEGLTHVERLLALEPDVVAHDLHPGYLSTQYAVARFAPARRIPVQHHHAHVASCAAEHGLTGPVLGIAYDGLGLGDDGTLWGGEVLLADLRTYRRLGRFGRAPLPGGALAVRRPYRMALGYLLAAEDVGGGSNGDGRGPAGSIGHGGDDGGGADDGGSRRRAGLADRELVAQLVARWDPAEVEVIRTQVRRGLNAPLASSAGRLVDAVAALLGLRDVVSHEAQAAVDLERAAGDVRAPALPYRLIRSGEVLVYDPRPTLTAVGVAWADGARATGPEAGADPDASGAGADPGASEAGADPDSSEAGDARVATVAAAFHETLVEVTCELLDDARRRTGVDVVCLSGGVLQNRRLATSLVARLSDDRFEVHLNEQVPCNDGGISYGQAAIAAATTQEV